MFSPEIMNLIIRIKARFINLVFVKTFFLIKTIFLGLIKLKKLIKGDKIFLKLFINVFQFNFFLILLRDKLNYFRNDTKLLQLFNLFHFSFNWLFCFLFLFALIYFSLYFPVFSLLPSSEDLMLKFYIR